MLCRSKANDIDREYAWIIYDLDWREKEARRQSKLEGWSNYDDGVYEKLKICMRMAPKRRQEKLDAVWNDFEKKWGLGPSDGRLWREMLTIRA